jgi:pimeloyl-ACP methyl ester carboxylesterase
MDSDAVVRITRHPDHWLFEPVVGTIKRTGLVFFPGSMVDPAAYGPLARGLAAEGYTVAIVPLPLRSAPLKSHKAAVDQSAANVILHSRDSGPARWVVSGHSLGGVFASRFTRDHPELVAGLILVGTSHPRDFDISHLPIDVTKIYGTRDGLASPEEVRRYAHNLPRSTHWVEIAGGNHAQFGWYGIQLGDRTAAISHVDQQGQLARAVRASMARVENRPEPDAEHTEKSVRVSR